MKHLIVMTVAALILPFSISPAAQAQPLISESHAPTYGRNDGWRRGDARYDRSRRSGHERVLRELALTRSQERRIENILARDERELSRMRQRLHVLERDYAELQRRRHPRARVVLHELRTLEERISAQRWRTRQRVEAVLTPRQRARLARYEREIVRSGRGGYGRDRRGFAESGMWIDLFADGASRR